MRAEIISVGTELLLGQITDTNAVYLARVLAEHGVDLFFKQTVGDNPTRIIEAVHLAVSRADLILMTGGLGPTEDDLTLEAVASAVGLRMVHVPEVEQHIRAFFKARGRPAPESVFKQALVPEGTEVIPNHRGTAPGVMITHEGRTIMIMPGVPAEMEGMVESALIPWLRDRTGDVVIRSRVLRITGLGESAVEEQIKDLLHMGSPTIAPYAKLGEVHLRITAKGTPAEVREHLDAGESALRGRLGDLIFGVDDETLEMVTGRLLLQGRTTIAVAESCTGGLITDRLTNVPGSSSYLLHGVVAYSNEAKVRLLGVTEALISTHGAVSAPVAEEMARGVRARARSDLGLAVTGIAGPTGGTPQKPVGLVYLALTGSEGEEMRELRFGSEAGRRGIKFLASQAALNLLRLSLIRKR